MPVGFGSLGIKYDDAISVEKLPVPKAPAPADEHAMKVEYDNLLKEQRKLEELEVLLALQQEEVKLAELMAGAVLEKQGVDVQDTIQGHLGCNK